MHRKNEVLRIKKWSLVYEIPDLRSPPPKFNSTSSMHTKTNRCPRLRISCLTVGSQVCGLSESRLQCKWVLCKPQCKWVVVQPPNRSPERVGPTPESPVCLSQCKWVLVRLPDRSDHFRYLHHDSTFEFLSPQLFFSRKIDFEPICSDASEIFMAIRHNSISVAPWNYFL